MSVPALRSAVVVVVLVTASCGGGVAGSVAPVTHGPSALSPMPVPKGFVVYRSDAPAFSLAHPATWRTKTDVSPALVAFLSPTTASGDAFAENVNVLRQDVPAGTTLEQYTDASLAQAGRIVDRFAKVSQMSAMLSGLPAVAIEYTGTVQGRSLHWFAEWTISGWDAWVLTYTAESDSYGVFLEEARTTIESFRLG